MIKIALIALVLMSNLFAFSLCRIAALADAQMEKDFHKWMEQQAPNKQKDTALADF